MVAVLTLSPFTGVAGAREKGAASWRHPVIVSHCSLSREKSKLEQKLNTRRKSVPKSSLFVVLEDDNGCWIQPMWRQPMMV